ncbi:MAG: 23S rRNA (adenine(2503)-C(2))-methyltransferase RlmN [Parachlamydiales bacterium]|jgi:23S rRNA (adenine2503-C2)-methyltransferase
MFFLSLSDNEIKKFLLDNNFKPFNFNQINDWIYQKDIASFDEMSNLSFDLRKKLTQNFELFSIKLKNVFTSSDNETIKYLFELNDGYFIESVLILSEKRTTLCLSTQVGCPIGCSFCSSGKNGFFRNLKLYEIIEQILFVKSLFKQKPTNIVFMGMGEPLLNFDVLIDAIKIITSEKHFNISSRKVTISTVGIIENIKKLQNQSLKVNLAISLHAADDKIRNQLIPFSKNYKIEDLIETVVSYFETTKRDISIEYILIDGVNDSIEDAEKLAYLLIRVQGSINLIPYNPIKDCDYKRSNPQNVQKFKSYLLSQKCNVSQRYTKGDDISAACGQLAFTQMGHN